MESEALPRNRDFQDAFRIRKLKFEATLFQQAFSFGLQRQGSLSRIPFA